MTNESEVLWILLSGRLKGRSGPLDSFPRLDGEPFLRLVPGEGGLDPTTADEQGGGAAPTKEDKGWMQTGALAIYDL